MTLARVRDYALAGANSISVGRITHSVEAADISLAISYPQGHDGRNR
jgi:nicotinate-nucleotide pyrophosphorylase